jgi:hypothetical protein
MRNRTRNLSSVISVIAFVVTAGTVASSCDRQASPPDTEKQLFCEHVRGDIDTLLTSIRNPRVVKVIDPLAMVDGANGFLQTAMDFCTGKLPSELDGLIVAGDLSAIQTKLEELRAMLIRMSKSST